MLINTVTPKELSINPYDLLTNVIVYYPMQWDMHDEWPNWWDFSTLAGSYTGASYNTFTNFRWVNTSWTYQTTNSISLWFYANWTDGVSLWLWSDSNGWWGLNITWKRIAAVISWSAYETASLSSLSWWNFIVWVFDYSGRTLKFYVNWELQQTKNLPASWWLRWWSWIVIWWLSNSSWVLNWKQWITFATQNAMTQADIQAFYNASKSLYQ